MSSTEVAPKVEVESKSEQRESSVFNDIGTIASRVGDFIRDLYSSGKAPEEKKGEDPQKLENSDKSLEKKNDSQGKLKSDIWDQIP
ncbi:MAG: hypothetical protein SFY67_05165 [Candidatus Melainabacteria bacterium]|nr:hypothetical protein [Candidatus Melainabacteria bacterium]